MSGSALTVFNAGTGQNAVTKGGTTTYLSKKAYGELHCIKGAALSRAHLQYRIDRGVAGNRNLAGLIAGGQIVAEKMKPTMDGFKVKFTFASKMGAAPVDPKSAAKSLSDAELLAIIESRKPAVQQPAQAEPAIEA